MSQTTESKPRLPAVSAIPTTPANGTGNGSHGSNGGGQPPEWLVLVQQHVRDLRFGTVQITVHNGRVTQVDSTRRTRFGPDTEGVGTSISPQS